MKAKRILVIGIGALLVCGIGLAIAKNHSEDVVSSTSLSAVGEKNYTYGVENEPPNSLWKIFYKFTPTNEYIEFVNLPDEFTWFEYTSPVFNNEHFEVYY
ncbi:MAG: hypothetical protein ACXQTS_00660, partial [Candidatus Methanospirareceae archaeon]